MAELIGSVVPNYGGHYSDRMVWREDKLVEFCRATDLRTTISVIADDTNPGVSTTRMGEVLAWKRFEAPFGLGQRDNREAFVEVISDFRQARANVLIRHRCLMHDLQQRSTGRLDEETFFTNFENLTRKGLSSALTKEKLSMVSDSLGVIGGTAAVVGAPAIASYYLLFSGIFSNLIIPHADIWNFEEPSQPWIPYLRVRVLEVFFGIVFGGASFIMGEAAINTTKENIRTGYPYKLSFQDEYNPFKHLKSLTLGRLYLATKGRGLVEHK